MAAENDSNRGTSTSAGIAAVVEPIKAIGALAGFAVGFAAAHRSGADLTGATLHGLLGATLLFLIAWYLGLWLVREMMMGHVEEQRRLYTERIEELKAQAAGTDGTTLQLPDSVPRAVLGPGGTGAGR